AVVRLPRQNFGNGFAGPAKWALRFSLIEAIDPDGVVKTCAAEPVSPLRLADVSVRAGIDQDVAIVTPADDLECMGVAVSGMAIAKGSDVGDDVGAAVGKHGDARIREEAAAGRPDSLTGSRPEGAVPQPPGGLHENIFRRVQPIGTIQIDAAGSQRGVA